MQKDGQRSIGNDVLNNRRATPFASEADYLAALRDVLEKDYGLQITDEECKKCGDGITTMLNLVLVLK